jgi:hypothetical protein
MITVAAHFRSRLTMRLTAIALLLTFVAFAPVSGQTAAVIQYPYGLDPYNPRDAEILRNYGSVLVAQTPLSELRKLDPYNPHHLALLRSLGGGIPLWAPWYLGPTPASFTPSLTTTGASAPVNVLVLLAGQLPAREAAPSTTPTVATPGASPGAVVTLLRPESNDGLWIRYAGQRWISSGAAVPFEESDFMRIGQYGNFPVFTRRGADEDLIYVPTRQDLVAPYRLKR